MAQNGPAARRNHEKMAEAAEVYLLMKEEYRISRNTRAAWFFNHLNKPVTCKKDQEVLQSDEELEVLSVLPSQEEISENCNYEASSTYEMVPSTHVSFLARRYRMVFIFDFSPSMASVDIQLGQVNIMNSFNCLSNCLRGLIQPFHVPGSSLILSPKIYITVIAYTPVSALTTQQVLVQGQLVTADVVEDVLQDLQHQVEDFENKLFSCVNKEDPDSNGYFLSPQSSGTSQSPPEMAFPESCFMNMLWCGYLALQLLPANTSAGIVMITDGVIGVREDPILNNALAQLRDSTIACSFIQVGHGFLPHSGFGYIPHTEIMQFIATATLGSFLDQCPVVPVDESGEMNFYHSALLVWSFQKDLNPLKGYQQSLVTAPSSSEPISSLKSIGLRKPRFPNLPLQRVKHREETLQTDLFNVMAVRLREGYTIKHVSVLKSKGLIEVRLALPCSHSGQIEYVARGPWPPLSNRKVTHIEVLMEGTYDFVHDINCPLKKTETRSTFKKRVIKNFWQMIKSLKDTDKLLVHMQSFAVNPAFYVVPEGTSKGMPLFYMPPNSDDPVLSLQLAKKDDSLFQFAQFWKRIALMEPKQWQRWLHTHRIALLLMPDLPLPKHLHHPNTSGRFGNVQCKLAQKELNALLTDWATFILLENHSYINITYEDKNSPPTSFFIIRVICKGLTVVLRLAFLGGTPAYVRNKRVNELKEKLAGLSMSLKLIHSKDPTRIAKGRKISIKGEDQKHTLKKPCVLLLQRPVEVVLVKYEKMPTDFTDLKLSSEVTAPSVPVYMNRGPDKKLNRLACYLHHRRWIWDAQGDQSIQISSQNVLSVLTRFKLQQEFRIAYSQSGIISFIAELNLKSVLKTPPKGNAEMEESLVESERTAPADGENLLQEAEGTEERSNLEEWTCEGEVFKCLVQYVIFPPHVETLTKVQDPGDDEDMDMSEADGKLQLITECWVEPQCGTITDSPAGREFFNGQQYMNVPDLLFPWDDEIVRTLLTYEHLKAMCSKESDGTPSNETSVSPQLSSTPCIPITESILHVPFSLDILQLIPKCRQLEMVCSTFSEALTPVPREGLQYPRPNETLFNLLLSSLSGEGTTNFELNMTKEQSLKFCDMILKKDYSERSPPFKITQEEVSAIISDMDKLNNQKNSRARSGSELGESRGNRRRPRADTIDEADVLPKIPEWTCFVKSFSSDSLLLVILPSSYKELVKLQGKAHTPLEAESDSGSLSGTGVDKNASKEKAVAEGLEEKSKAQTTKANVTLKTGKEGRSENPVKGKRKKLKKLRRHSEEEPKISYSLPIFVYECTFSSLTNHLLKNQSGKVQKDVVKDITFASMERSTVPGTPRSSRRVGRIPSDSDEWSEASKKASFSSDVEKSHMSRELEWFFCLLSNKVQKAFVVAVFKSLQQGQIIERKDVLAAVDNICVETLREIDITNYMQAVCGHVRETSDTVREVCEESVTKDSYRKQLKFSEEIKTDKGAEEDKTEDQTDEGLTGEENVSNPVIKKESICRIPMSAFLAGQTCEVQTGLHNLIKTKFTQIMGSYFKQIPSNENLWFYRSHDMDDLPQYSSQSQTTTQDEVETSGTEFVAEKDLLQVDGKRQLTDISQSENTSESNTSSKEEFRKINSIVDNYVTLKLPDEFSDGLSDDGRTSIMSQCGSMEEEISPLFVTLVCTIKHKSNVGNMPVQTIPACLGVLLDCLEQPEEEIVLGDLRLTLDLICLTLPPDFDVCTPYDEEGSEHSERRRGTSFTEPSPPESPPAEIIRSNLRSGFKFSVSDFDDFNSEFVEDTLESLPEHQKNSIQDTQEEIKWLLKDEIASASRHIFPVTATTLDMVADHVCNSLGKDTCLHRQVDLKFVFGPEQSLSEFIKAFEEIKVTGYKLNKIHDRYYLSLDQITIDKDLDGSWPSDQLADQLPQVSNSDISISISGSTSDVTTKITFTPPSPQKYSDALKDKNREEEQDSESVPSQVKVFEKVAEKLTETTEPGGTVAQECMEEPQKIQFFMKESFESEDKSGKYGDDTEKDVRDGEEVDQEAEKETGKGAREIVGNTRMLDEMQDSSKSSLVSSEWQSATESLTNQTESDSDSDIQVLSDEDGREAAAGMKLDSRGLVIGSLEENEDSQRTLTRTSGILVLKKGEMLGNYGGERQEDTTEDGISPVRWSNSESGMLGSESSVSSQQRSDSSLGFATEGLSQFVAATQPDGSSSEIQGRGVFDPPKVKRLSLQNGKQFEERLDGDDLAKAQVANEMSTLEDIKTDKPETEDSSKVKISEPEHEMEQSAIRPQKQRNSSGDSSNAFSPRDQEFPNRYDGPRGQTVGNKGNSSTAHRVGRTRDTPVSRQASSTGGTSISGPLSAQVSCNSLSGSLTECDEEGYEAGSSEDEYGDSHVFSEDDFNAKQKMPDFWLILKIQEDKEELENKKYTMNMYFHTRDRGDGVRLQAQKATFDQVADAIEKTCRLVSQRLLLIDLFDSKICNPLLLADDENWNKENEYTMPTHGRYSSDSGPDLNVMEEGDYLKARMEFDPGHFACAEQFTAHLVVHSRLPSTRKGTSKMSGGMQAVKTALEAFAISNRPDLYVVKDDSGEVFYIRLSELSSSNVHPTSSRVSIASDSLAGTEPGSVQVSRVPSVQNLVTDDDLPAPSATDSARDPIPESSKGPFSHGRTISVSVYGLTKPGPEIHRDLISLLQKRLDQVTLDVIKDMLDKNAMSRLTVADVQFIQPPGKAPTKTVQFTIPVWSVRYVFAIGFYLQQNLLEFLYVPKYVDSRPMYHFQDYTLKDKGPERPSLLERDTFLYNRPHRAGGTGIACIIASVVDGKGNTVSLQTCPKPSPDGYQEIMAPGNLHQLNGDDSSKLISPVDFQQLTTTKEYQPSRIGAKGPGPAFLFQFNIWERGNIDVAHLITKLEEAVHHALCDVIMEYRILTAPLASPSPEVLSGLKNNSNLAPLSPTGALRAELFRKLGPTSNPVVPQTVPVKKRSFSVGETDMRSLWKNFHLKTSESSSLTSYSPISPPEMPRSAEPSQHPATHPVKILKRSSGSTPRSPSISSADSGSKSSKRQLVFDKKEVEPSSDHSPLPSHPTTPTKGPSAEPSPRKASKEEPTWQTREQERRHNEELNKCLREAEDGLTGRLHWVYTNLARQWLDFEKESQICSVHKVTEKLQSRFSVDLVLLSLVTKLPQVCADTTFKLFKKTGEGFTFYQPPGPKKNRFSSSQGQHRNIPKPGTQGNFVLIGRNIHQWRYSLDYRLTEEDAKVPDLINPQSRKSFQQFNPCDLRSPGNSELSKLMSSKGSTQSLHLVPRQRLLILYVRDKELTLYTYNWSAELVHSLEAFFHRLIMWHNSRSHLVDCLVMQKMGLYHHKDFGDTGQKDNPFCKYMSEIDSLVKQLLPPTQSTSTHGPSTSLPRSQRKRHPILPPFDETMAVGKIPRPLHMSHFNAWTDPVLRHGAQLQEICNHTRRDSDIQMKLQGLYTAWQKRRTYQPISFDTLETLKQQSRLLTHCATPILFSPQWRKHALQDHRDSEPVSLSPGSPVHEETWHVSLRLSFLQQYMQYLTMNRFHVIETTPDSPRRSFSLTNRIGREGRRKLPEGHGKRLKTTAVKYMQITVLGGIILAELSFEHVFFCVRLYAFESSRLPRELNINSRLGMLFTDECDSFKDLIHLHSFSYDFHLRTVQDYLSSPEMGFKVQYHVTSFLSDFIKFYNPIPRFCKSVIHSETQGFLSHNTPAPDLYDYLTKHKLSEFFILHMARPDASEEQELESALVSFNRGHFIEYHSRGHTNPDDISVSFIISWDQKEYESSTRPGTPIPGYICEAAALSSQSESEKNKNLMRLKYYLIVNSMKQLYPERGRGLTLGKGAMAGAEADLLAMERNPRYLFTMNEMEKKRELVKELVSQAATSCRRDMLWDKLLKYETDNVAPSKKSKKKDPNEGMVELAISYAEFKVLLESVVKMSLTNTDDRLVALLDNSRPWYENLLHSLRVKFNIMARYFKSEDGMIHQLAILNQTYKSMMVLLTVDFQASAVELDAVYKAQQDWNAGSQESQNQEDLCCQKHVEMVINAICFHLWTSIL